jgi:hypothetical protein
VCVCVCVCVQNVEGCRCSRHPHVPPTPEVVQRQHQHQRLSPPMAPVGIRLSPRKSETQSQDVRRDREGPRQRRGDRPAASVLGTLLHRQGRCSRWCHSGVEDYRATRCHCGAGHGVLPNLSFGPVVDSLAHDVGSWHCQRRTFADQPRGHSHELCVIIGHQNLVANLLCLQSSVDLVFVALCT